MEGGGREAGKKAESTYLSLCSAEWIGFRNRTLGIQTRPSCICVCVKCVCVKCVCVK